MHQYGNSNVYSPGEHVPFGGALRHLEYVLRSEPGLATFKPFRGMTFPVAEVASFLLNMKFTLAISVMGQAAKLRLDLFSRCGRQKSYAEAQARCC